MAGMGILLVVFALLVGGGIALALALVASTSSDLALTVDTCEIAADGTLRATGTVSHGGDEDDTEVVVTFFDSSNDTTVDSQRTDVVLRSGEGSWTASGRAGDSVQQVTCEATVSD